MRTRAIVLLSGGLDSTTCLAWAQARYECMAISFMYGQRSTTELDAAKALAQRAGVEHRIINIDLSNLGGSALTDHSIDVPEHVQVNEVVGEQTTVIELKVDKTDLRKIIGKLGRTARALRTILNAASTKLKKRSVLEIIE